MLLAMWATQKARPLLIACKSFGKAVWRIFGTPDAIWRT
jgi:hypothetical protein